MVQISLVSRERRQADVRQNYERESLITPTSGREAAHAAAHTKHMYLSAFYRYIRVRRGTKQVMIADRHAILVICYHLLDWYVLYEELGGNYFDERDR